MKKFKTVDEIRNAFIKEGWNNETNFTELTLKQAQEKGYLSIASDIKNGKKYFVMNVSLNIFDDEGKIAYYNI